MTITATLETDAPTLSIHNATKMKNKESTWYQTNFTKKGKYFPYKQTSKDAGSNTTALTHRELPLT